MKDEIGKYYYTSWGDGNEFIYKIKSTKSNGGNVPAHKIVMKLKYYKDDIISGESGHRHATEEETTWLDACIEAGEYVEKEIALSARNPNYYELTF